MRFYLPMISLVVTGLLLAGCREAATSVAQSPTPPAPSNASNMPPDADTISSDWSYEVTLGNLEPDDASADEALGLTGGTLLFSPTETNLSSLTDKLSSEALSPSDEAPDPLPRPSLY